MQIKVGLGKLELARPPAELVQFELDRGSVALLAITLAHVSEISRLPSHHRYPFDRILIAQAIHEALTLVTADRRIHLYPARWLWE